MIGWRDIWKQLVSFLESHPVGSALALICTAIVIWPRQLMEGIQYLCYLFRDKAVHDALLERMHGRHGRGYTVAELAELTGRKEPSVLGSLRRLKYDHKAKDNAKGWYGFKL
jgi:hypothetical protein